MSKQTINWHQEGLGNMIRNVGLKRAELARLQSEIQRDELAIELKQTQIDRALYEGKEEFDSELYLKKRGRGLI